MILPLVEPGQEITAALWNAHVAALNDLLSGGGGYDLMDGIDGVVSDGTLFIGKAMSAFEWTKGAASVDVAPSQTLTITAYRNGDAVAEITIAPGAYASTSSGFPVQISSGDVVKVVLANASGAQNLAYGIGQNGV